MAGHIELIDKELKSSSDDEISKDKLEKLDYSTSAISKSLTRSKNLIEQILVFSRNKILNFEVLDLKKVILETMNLIKETSDTNINFTTDLEDELYIYGDQTRVVQIFLNLLINSINAIDLNNAQIDIITAHDTEKFNEYLLKTLKEKIYDSKIRYFDKGCVITIKDNGKGMTQEQIANAFDPFSSIKNSGKGSGLGLGIVHNNVTSLGGLVTINSEVGKYTEVEIKLPLVHPIKISLDKDKRSIQKGDSFDFTNIKILLIDDEPDIVDSYSKILQKLGAKVLSAIDGKKAWEIYQNNYQDLDLIILDIKMPGMSGIELLKLIREKDPTQKVIFMTGYSDEFIEKEGVEILQKPFQISDLIRLLRKLNSSNH